MFKVNFADNQLQLQTKFNASSLKLDKMNAQDLAYDQSRKNLFILDYHTGVIPLKLTVTDTSI